MSFPLPDDILQLPDIAVKQIMKQVVHLQNGDVSKAMEKAGYKYDVNYGVSIPQLRDLATKYKPDKAMAIQLRQYANIREALILSSMLDEPNKLTSNEILELCKLITNIELVEQFSRNLFARTNKLIDFCKQIISENETCKTICFMSLGWAIKFKNAFSSSDINWMLEQLNNIDGIEDFKTTKAIMLLMQAISSEMVEMTKEINKMAEKFAKSDNSAIARMGDEFLWINAV